MENQGEIRVYNPQEGISREITLEILIRHRDSMKQARTGILVGSDEFPKDENEKRLNQARALMLIIASQREMINISRPHINFRSLQKWKKSHKSEEDKEKFPFFEDINLLQPHSMKYDYFKLMYWLELLKACEQDIIEADRSKTLDDDYIREVENSLDGSKTLHLTKNFFEMLNELENSYEQIYLLMLTNKIVSAGIEEDEELTYKEKEQEAIRRVVEA